LVVQINKKKNQQKKTKWRIKWRIFHSSVNFYANQLNLGIWKERLFFQNFKWQIKSRWRQQPLFYSFGSHTVISQPILKCQQIFWVK
jgi:hypothetical protein